MKQWFANTVSSLSSVAVIKWPPFGSVCRTWLYEPKMPQKLVDLDKD